MNILLCMDSWKGSLQAAEACRAVARGIKHAVPAAVCRSVPMADGGEGTLALLRQIRSGVEISVTVQGPLQGQRITDVYLTWPGTGEAFIEMARCAGLTLLQPHERMPLQTTTYGVGEWISHAVSRGFPDLTLAVGGSGTVDGGVGMARALGWSFTDAAGNEIGPGGGGLSDLAAISPPQTPVNMQLKVMCDVTNPLLGPRGAAAVFGPQKGASPKEVTLLEEGLTRLADCVERDLGLRIHDIPGGAAAGGIAAGAKAFFGAELVSGVEEMIRLTGLEPLMKESDWVVTGEGNFDAQSLDGKVVSGILSCARNSPARLAVIAGQCTGDPAAWSAAGLDAVYSANHENLPLSEAMEQAAVLAENAGRRFAEEQLLPHRSAIARNF